MEEKQTIADRFHHGVYVPALIKTKQLQNELKEVNEKQTQLIGALQIAQAELAEIEKFREVVFK